MAPCVCACVSVWVISINDVYTCFVREKYCAHTYGVLNEIHPFAMITIDITLKAFVIVQCLNPHSIFLKCHLKCVSKRNDWFWGNEPIQSVIEAFSVFVYLNSNLIIQITQYKIIPFFKIICAPSMILCASEISCILQQFRSSFPVYMLPRSSSHSHECTCTHECAHNHIHRVTNPNSFRPSVLSGSSRTPRSSWGWWDSRSSRNHVDATSKTFSLSAVLFWPQGGAV